MLEINIANLQEHEIIRAKQYDEYDTVNLVIPAEIRVIDKYAFARFGKLETLKFERGSAIEIIEEDAFSGCPQLKSVVLPKNLRVIGKRAFAGCSKLGDVTFEKNNQLEIIGEQAFMMVGKNLMGYEFKSHPLVFSSNFKSLGEKAFSNCQNLLSEVDFSKVLYLSEIPMDAFCLSRIGKVTFPTSGCIKTIGESAFAHAGVTVIMPASGVRTIKRKAFSGSTLTEFDFRGVQHIEDLAFSSTNLGEVLIPTTCQLGTGVFDAFLSNCRVYRKDLPLLEPYDSSTTNIGNSESLSDKLKGLFGRFKK